MTTLGSLFVIVTRMTMLDDLTQNMRSEKEYIFVDKRSHEYICV